MTETSTTNTNPAGVVAHGLHALAEHFDYRSLPAPLSITVAPKALIVHIPTQGAERWAVTLADGDGIHCVDIVDGHAHFQTRGLLPDTGVRVVLTWQSRALAAVPA